MRSPRVGGAYTPSTRRSIPACTGEPPSQRKSARLSAVNWVYPRVYGGTPRAHAGIEEHGGLSPRVRGNLAHLAASPGEVWSIPACTGEPPSGLRWRHYPTSGLSPRVRGNRRGRRSACDRVRSIPACAGEPRGVVSRPRRRSGLSPRVRGNPARHPLHSLMLTHGLSPRVRGNLTTLPAGPVSTRSWVYPRVCGGTTPRYHLAASWTGLSPRVRGTPVASGVE